MLKKEAHFYLITYTFIEIYAYIYALYKDPFILFKTLQKEEDIHSKVAGHSEEIKSFARHI